MDIQATLTLTIQAVVISFVALMVFDFVDGLWVVPLPPAGWQPLQGEQPTVSAVATQPTCVIAQQFEEILDPWTLQPQSPHHSVPAPFVIVPFPPVRVVARMALRKEKIVEAAGVQRSGGAGEKEEVLGIAFGYLEIPLCTPAPLPLCNPYAAYSSA